MEKRSIVFPKNIDRMGKSLETALTQSDSVPAHYIHDCVEKILTMYKFAVHKEFDAEGRFVTFIANILSRDNVFRLIRQHDKSIPTADKKILLQLSDEEIDNAIDNIRDALLKELEQHHDVFDGDTFFLLRRIITDAALRSPGVGLGNTVAEIHGTDTSKKIYKQNAVYMRNEEYATAHDIAIRTLGSIPPNPHIINIESFDTDSGEIIEEYKDAVSLRDLYQNMDVHDGIAEFDDFIDTKMLLDIIRDLLETCIFLRDHELMLQDIKSSNVLVDKKTKRMLFVDLDGLTPLNYSLKSRICTEAYMPPELKTNIFEQMYDKRSMGSMPTSEKEMVYQCGLIIEGICTHADKYLSSRIIRKIKKCQQKMCKNNPHVRISLDEALRELSSVMDK